jgi:hypothetical protein
MTGIFPTGGVGAEQAINTAVLPAINQVAGCPPTFHSTGRCTPRFDPASANALISEFLNLVICAGTTYDCNSLTNLCTAVRAMSFKPFTDCLDDSIVLPDSSGSCKIERLVLTTDSEGCRRITRYNETAAILTRFDLVSNYGNPNGPTSIPATPTNAATYYNFGELSLARQSNTINPAKLTPNRLWAAEVTLTCEGVIEITQRGTLAFSPTQNSGNGAQSQVVFRIDGVFPLDANGNVLTSGTWNNFESVLDNTFTYPLSAGTHTIETFVVASFPGLQPAQAIITTATVGGAVASSWGGEIRVAQS